LKEICCDNLEDGLETTMGGDAQTDDWGCALWSKSTPDSVRDISQKDRDEKDSNSSLEEVYWIH
jgi:hypothetical protein